MKSQERHILNWRMECRKKKEFIDKTAHLHHQIPKHWFPQHSCWWSSELNLQADLYPVITQAVNVLMLVRYWSKSVHCYGSVQTVYASWNKVSRSSVLNGNQGWRSNDLPTCESKVRELEPSSYDTFWPERKKAFEGWTCRHWESLSMRQMSPSQKAALTFSARCS